MSDKDDWARMRKRVDYSLSLNSRIDNHNINTDTVRAEAVKTAESAAKGPSLFQRAIDVLSRGNYMAAAAYQKRAEHDLESGGNISFGERVNMLPFNPVFWAKAGNDLLHGGEEWHAAVSGLAGTKKTTFADVLDTTNPELDGWQKGALSFGLDVAVDPTSYIGAGLVGKAGKVIGLGSKGGKAGREAAEIVGRAVDDVADTQRGFEPPKSFETATKGKVAAPYATPSARNVPNEAGPVESGMTTLRSGEVGDEVPEQLGFDFKSDFTHGPEVKPSPVGAPVVGKEMPFPGMTIKSLGGRKAPKEQIDDALNSIHPQEPVKVSIPSTLIGGKATPSPSSVGKQAVEAEGKSVAAIGKLPPIAEVVVRRMPKNVALANHSLDELFDASGSVTKAGEQAVEMVRRGRIARNAVENPRQEAWRRLYSHQVNDESYGSGGWPRIHDDPDSIKNVLTKDVSETGKGNIELLMKGKTNPVKITPLQLWKLLVDGEHFPGYDDALRISDPTTGKRIAIGDYIANVEKQMDEFDPKAALVKQTDPAVIAQELKQEYSNVVINKEARAKAEDFIAAGREAGFPDELLAHMVEETARVTATVQKRLEFAAKIQEGHAIREGDLIASGKLEGLTEKQVYSELAKLGRDFVKYAETEREKAVGRFLQKIVDAEVPPEAILDTFRVFTAQQGHLFTEAAAVKMGEKTGQYAKQAKKKGNAFGNPITEMAREIEQSPVGDAIAVNAAKKDPEIAEQMVQPIVKDSDLVTETDHIPLTEYETELVAKHVQAGIEGIKAGKFGARSWNPAKTQNAARAALEDWSKDHKFAGNFKIEDQRAFNRGQAPSKGREAAWNEMVKQENIVYARLLKAIEDSARDLGYPPHWWAAKGSKVLPHARVSDIIARIDAKAFKAANGGKAMRYTDIVSKLVARDEKAWASLVEENPAIAQLLDDGRRATLLRDSVVADRVAETAADSVEAVVRSPAARAEAGSAAKTSAKPVLVGANVSDVDKAGKVVDDAIDEVTPPKFEDAGSTGDASFNGSSAAHAKSNAAQARSTVTMDALREGEQQNTKFWQMSQEFFTRAGGKILTTRYRLAGLRLAELRAVGYAHAMAARRAGNIVHLRNNYTREQILTAWPVARGLSEAATPEIADLAAALRGEIEWLFGSTSIGRKNVKGNAAVVAQGIDRDTMNKYLARVGYGKKFQFKDGKVKVEGKERDFSGEGNWLNSWEAAEIDEPLEFIHHLNVAAEQASIERSLFTMLAHDLGSSAKSGSHTTQVNNQWLKGQHFEPEVAAQIEKMSEHIEDFYRGTNSAALKTFDQVLSLWKTSVTIYMPSHHVRNLIGDTYFAWMDGVTNPKFYKNAIKVLRANKIHYSDVGDTALGKLEDRRGFIDALTQGRKVTEDELAANHPQLDDIVGHVKINGKKVPFTAEQAYRMMNDQGILPHANIVEDIPGEWSGAAGLMDKVQPFGGKVGRGVRKVSEGREHYVRMAHFLHAMERKGYKSLDEALVKSGARVRKWHPDGTDLTEFERRVMRRVIPFYSWQRKAIPLIVESAVRNPGKTSVYFKAQHNAALAMGVPQESPSDPFPLDDEFPSWIRGIGIGPVFGHPGGYQIVNPSNPFIDAGNQFLNNPLRSIGSMINPAVRIPAELTFGQDIRTGAPLENKTEYLDKQVPGLAPLNRVLNADIGASTVQGWANGGFTDPYQTEKQKGQGFFDPAAIANSLFAAGNLDTSEYKGQAEYETQQAKYKANAKVKRQIEMDSPTPEIAEERWKAYLRLQRQKEKAQMSLGQTG